MMIEVRFELAAERHRSHHVSHPAGSRSVCSDGLGDGGHNLGKLGLERRTAHQEAINIGHGGELCGGE